MAQLQEFVLEKSPNIEIMVTGKDEMKAASVLVDYFNHGLGIKPTRWISLSKLSERQ